MERNQETLSTRDLAMGNDPVADTGSASDPGREPSGEAPTEVYDREAALHEPPPGRREGTTRLRMTCDPKRNDGTGR